MNVTRFQPFGQEELLTRLRQTRLKGHGQPLVYEHARLELALQADPATLFPAQNYVLQSDHQRLLDLYHLFQGQGIDIFALEGGIYFWSEEDGVEEGPIPLIPPVVELSREPDGRVVPLINDGMHRVYTAMALERKINVVLAHDVPEAWPYYAFAREEGWRGVVELEELPENFVKKAYRDPAQYKALFRDFNAVFPGIQKQRAKSNPAHLKA